MRSPSLDLQSASDTVVVVGFAEALSAPESVWSLVDAGFKVVAFARKGRRSALRVSRHVSVRDITAPESDFTGALSGLSSLITECGAESKARVILLPLDDTAVWLGSCLPESPGFLLAGPRDACRDFALDKAIQVRLAAESGFNVPMASIVTNHQELRQCAAQLPLILRPSKAVWSDGTRTRKGHNWICSNDEEFERAVSVWKGNGPLLVQPFLQGSGEGVFGFSTGAGLVNVSSHRRVRMMNPHGSGSSACAAQPLPREVGSCVEDLIRKSGWRGLFMVELLRDTTGKLWFVEFNGRTWGSMALSRRQGLEYPAWAARLALNHEYVPPPSTKGFKETICRNLGRELMHLLFVVRGPRSQAIQTWPSVWRTVMELLAFGGVQRFYNWRRDDWRVFFADSFNTVRDQVVKSRS